MALPGIVGLLPRSTTWPARRGVSRHSLHPFPPDPEEMSLGYTGLFADLYWTRAVQYFGYEHHQHSKDFSLLAPCFTLATHSILSCSGLPVRQQFPRSSAANGAGQTRESDCAGTSRMGFETIRQLAALLPVWAHLLHRMKDYSKAAKAFASGGRVPGAPSFFCLYWRHAWRSMPVNRNRTHVVDDDLSDQSGPEHPAQRGRTTLGAPRR